MTPRRQNGGSTQDAVARFLRTGDYDIRFAAWPGSFLEQCTTGDAELRRALIQEVHRRAPSPKVPAPVRTLNLRELTASKTAPIVRGLFPKQEQENVLSLLKDCVVFLTPEALDGALLGQPWLSTAWQLANMYLASVGAERLGDKGGLQIVGLSEEATCYVSMDYFDEPDPFADFVVHEIAHVFHNCKRTAAGLPQVRGREWLLDVEYSKRETFAHACEAFSRILEQAATPADRRALAEEFAVGSTSTAWERDMVDTVRAAAAARNGWKTILQRCAPPGPESRNGRIRK